MNKLDRQYQALLRDILDNGVAKQDRTGTGTISVFGRQIRHTMSEGFPLLTTKKMPFKTITTELLWFLRGDTNIKFLVNNNCHIWDGDAYKAYCKIASAVEEPDYDIHVDDPNQNCTRLMTMGEFINKIKINDAFAKEWGELGPVYGKQWRSWNGLDKDFFINTDNMDDPLVGGHGLFYQPGEIDQIQNLINDLKTNPDSRRLMVNAWNVGELDQMVLPPCHYGFQVYTRELSEDERYDLLTQQMTKLRAIRDEDYIKYNIPTRAVSLMWNQRSVDTFLGLPFNIASYGLLLEIIAKEVNMVPDELIGNLGDVHLYSNHIDQAREQIGVPLNHEKRNELLKEAMGVEAYERAVSELVPFGGGLSEYYSSCKIPYSTRDPFPLPTLKIYSLDLDDIAHHEIGDFEIQNYQSHPSIKGELSN
jgi:thymidylate synthase